MKTKLLFIKSSTFFLLFISALSIHAQRASELRIQKAEQEKIERLFSDSEAMFKTTDIPEKYKQESGVILAQKLEYSFLEISQTFQIKEKIRKKILLLDKAIIEKYSTFYFQKQKSSYVNVADPEIGFALRVEKPDGKKILVDIKSAIKVESTSEVPDSYRFSNIETDNVYYKIAVPDLQPGDIIEMVSDVTTYGYSTTFYSFPTVIFALNSNLPIVKQKYVFNFPRGFFLNYHCSNGAPDLKKDETVSDRKNYVYTLESGNNDMVKSTRWLYKYRIFPTVKFQVIRSQIGQKGKFIISDKPDVPKTQITKEDMLEFVYEKCKKSDEVTNAVYAIIKNEINTFTKNIKDPEEYARTCYNYLRHQIVVNHKLGYTEVTSLKEEYFGTIMAQCLLDNNIPFELYLAAPKTVGDLKDAVTNDEFVWILKVKDKFMSNVASYINFGDLPYYVSNVDAYKIKLGKNKQETSLSIAKLPALDYHDSYYKSTEVLSFSEDMMKLNVEKATEVKGLMKVGFISNALATFDFAKKSYLLFHGVPDKDDQPETRNKVKLAEWERKKQSKIEEDKKTQIDLMKGAIDEDFKVGEYKKFELLNDGMSDKSPLLQYKEEYDLEDLVQKVGQNYILKLGNLLGGHLNFTDEERKREVPAFIDYPKTYSYTITIKIPQGYTVSGMEDFNQKIENENALFQSKLTNENNMLTFVANKIYKKEFIPKESWSDMLKFTDLAFDVSQKKLVFKK